MKTLNKYIFFELLKSFFVGLSIFTTILFISIFIYTLNMLISQRIDVLSVLFLLGLSVFTILSFSIPISFLFSVASTYGKMKEENEIIFLKSIGLSSKNYLLLPISLSILLSILLIFYNYEVDPRLQQLYHNTYRSVLKRQPLNIFFENTLTRIGDFTIFLSKMDRWTGQAQNIITHQIRQDGSIITAFSKYGHIKLIGSEFWLLLLNGMLYFSVPSTPENITVISFRRYRVTIPHSNIITYKNIKEMTTKELLREIKKTKFSISANNIFIKEFYLKQVLGFTPFVFCILSFALTFKLRFISKYFGFAICLFTSLIYYFLLIISLTISDRNPNITGLSLWTPNTVLLMFGLLFFIKIWQE